jgi:hypothetical protein
MIHGRFLNIEQSETEFHLRWQTDGEMQVPLYDTLLVCVISLDKIQTQAIDRGPQRLLQQAGHFVGRKIGGWGRTSQ